MSDKPINFPPSSEQIIDLVDLNVSVMTDFRDALTEPAIRAQAEFEGFMNKQSFVAVANHNPIFQEVCLGVIQDLKDGRVRELKLAA